VTHSASVLNAQLILASLSNDDLIGTVRERGLTDISRDTVSLTKLQRLDVSSNQLTSLNGLAIPSLTTLKAHHNRIARLVVASDFLRSLKSLDVSFNPVKSIGNISGCAHLTALIISNARLTALGDALTAVPRLNTLVVSNNELTSLKGVEHLRLLTALSASHNRLDNDVFAAISGAEELRKLRLNSNAGITQLPSRFSLVKLELLDVGKCGLATLRSARTCQTLDCLRTLNLMGNACCALKDYAKFCNSLPLSITSLDSRKRALAAVVAFSKFEAADDGQESESEDSAQDIDELMRRKKQDRLSKLSEAAAEAKADKKRSAAPAASTAAASSKKARTAQPFRPDAVAKAATFGSW
jgi:hypothetical protein